MLRTLALLDAAITFTRPAWAWMGQLALIALGVHLGADRIDDELSPWLANLGVAWPDPQTPVVLGTWGALALEFTIIGVATRCLIRSTRSPHAAWGDPRRHSPTPWILPLFWAPNVLAGAWVVGMAAEDLLAPWLSSAAAPIGWGAFLLVVWRLGWSGLRLVSQRVPEPDSLSTATITSLCLGLSAWLACVHALPVWGWR